MDELKCHPFTFQPAAPVFATVKVAGQLSPYKDSPLKSMWHGQCNTRSKSPSNVHYQFEPFGDRDVREQLVEGN